MAHGLIHDGTGGENPQTCRLGLWEVTDKKKKRTAKNAVIAGIAWPYSFAGLPLKARRTAR